MSIPSRRKPCKQFERDVGVDDNITSEKGVLVVGNGGGPGEHVEEDVKHRNLNSDPCTIGRLESPGDFVATRGREALTGNDEWGGRCGRIMVGPDVETEVAGDATGS